MLKLAKILFISSLFISNVVIAGSENLKSSMPNVFWTSYVVADSINAKDVVRERVIEDLANDHTHCAGKTPKFIDLIFSDSVYGPRYGQRTFYVDIYYSCPR